MNRSFRGNPEGSITEKITNYFQRTLLPLAEWVLDLHSGGKTLSFFLFAQPTGWKTNNRNNAALMRCGLSMHPTT